MAIASFYIFLAFMIFILKLIESPSLPMKNDTPIAIVVAGEERKSGLFSYMKYSRVQSVNQSNHLSSRTWDAVACRCMYYNSVVHL